MERISVNIKVWQAAVVTALVSCAVCLPVLDNQFVAWDDAQYIYQNIHLTKINGEFLRWAFFDQYWLLWMPLTWISYAIDLQLWGLTPLGFHLTSLMLHGLNTFFVALLTVQIVKISFNRNDTFISNSNLLFCAVVGGLLFAIHPLKVEPVAWASERKGLLNAAFAIPALMAYLRYASRQTTRHASLTENLCDRSYLSALILFILSLLCKPMSVTMPLIFLILDWFPLNRFKTKGDFRSLLVEKIPFFVISFAISTTTLFLKPISGISFSEISIWSRVHVACRSLIEYLRLTIWPNDLIALYDHPGNSVPLLSWQFVWPILAVALITVGCIYRAHNDKTWLTSWLCYVTLLFPVLGFAQNGGQAMADRFMYLPGITLTILFTAGCVLLYHRMVRLNTLDQRLRLALTTTIIALISGYGLATHALIRSWHDTETLWTRAVTVRPSQAGRAYYQRGLYWLETGNYARAAADATRSLEILNVIGYTRIAKVYALRAEAYEQLGQDAAAASDMKKLDSLPSPWTPQI